jgi:pyrimidine deaminase RibD-like protein
MKLIDLLDNATPTVAELAKKYKTDADHVQAQLTKGIKVELEHTSHEHVARRIALAHLGERLDYYTQLAKIDEDQISSHKPVQDPTLDTHNQTLSQMVAQDQTERNEYQQFVNTKAGGDWHKGAKMYAAFKNRSQDDVFGERAQLQKFMDMQFDFDQFTQTDWDNYWLLAQHCDFNRTFQKQALSIITKYLGTDHSHYRYLYDRISCGASGTQKYHTQDICGKDNTVSDLQQIQESIINNEQGWGKVPNNQNVDYLGLRVRMKPSMFLKLAAPLERADAHSVQDMVQHLNSGGTVASPWLVIHIPDAWEQGDYDQAARVTSHEGRNRMYAIQEVQGDAPVEVHVFFGAGMRARHIQPDWVDHMMHELIPQGQKKPQQGPWFTPMSHNVAEHVMEEVKPDVHSLRLDQIEKLMRGSKGYTFDIARRKLNVPNLIRKGVIFVTYPHDKSGWLINDQRDWSYSLITLYNMHGGGWTTQANKYKKPRSYTHAEQTINSSQPNLGNQQLVYDNKYLQILWSVKKLGLPDSEVYVDDHATPMEEAWSRKYKKSINCANPKGFSQRAHCAGRKARSAHKKTKSPSVSEANKSSAAHKVTHVTESHSELYDQILTILCDMIDYQYIHNPEKYGEVGAAIVDPDSRIVVALSTPHKGKWRHAEYNAIVAYNKKYGEIPPGSVVITTCSPCSARMPDRHGVSCTHRINELPIPIVYCGFEDPTQHTHLHNFQMVITQNAHIHRRCETYAQRFMDWELAQQNQHDPDPHSAAAQKANQLG